LLRVKNNPAAANNVTVLALQAKLYFTFPT